jgi:hypothetical protein
MRDAEGSLLLIALLLPLQERILLEIRLQLSQGSQ